MLRVIGCITNQHDLRLVVLAGLICTLGCYTSFSLSARAGAPLSGGPGARPHYGWLIAAAFVTGSGVWATHFVAELAFRPGLPVAYDINLTVLSVLVAVTLAGLGIAISLNKGYAAAGGAVVGLAVAAMHYTGMAALRLPATIHWDFGYVVASIVVSVVVSSLAVTVAMHRKNTSGRVLATGLLVLAIVGLHFTAMTAVQLHPDPTIAIPAQSIEPEWLAIAVSAVTVLIVGLGLAGSIVDQHLAERNSREAARLRDYVVTLEATKTDLEHTAARLRDALQAKSLFLAAMSHELRTPLNAIIGFSEVLKSELFGPIANARYREYHDHIFASGSHLLTLINDVLDISRLDTDQLELREETIDIETIVAQCLRQVERQAEKAKIGLRAGTASGTARLRADPMRLRQIILNVLSNAVKFTPEGGEVRVSTLLREEWLDIVVADTGIGMAAEDIPKALELFGQIDNSLARKYEGTGLGLPLVKQLIERHGGALTIHSAPGQGTSVTLSLPAWRICRQEQAA